MTSPVDELQARLARYPADRYPVQHATTQFHLGVAYTGQGRLDVAEEALRTACQLFKPDQLPAEHAKACNALGAVQRMTGRLDQAAESFRTAAALFASSSLPLEQGAALYNLGLVEQEAGGDGVEVLGQALDLLDPDQVPGQTAAAARELGASLLAAGRPDEAVPALEGAIELASRVGDRIGLGGAANVLGLAHLAAGRPADAVAALEQAVAAHPRSVRPDGYAMAKANLALAHEAAGRSGRARLAALQALGAPAAPTPVAAQATAVLHRTGAGAGALWAVLDEEPEDRWPALVREEAVRWADAGDAPRAAELQAWVAGQLARPSRAIVLAEALMAALIELPPAPMDLLLQATLHAVGEREEADQLMFARQCSQALARFPVPQLLRLKDAFEAGAGDLGLAATSW